MKLAHWLVAALIATASCGGSQKVEPAAEPPPPPEEPVEPEPVEAGPTQQEVCESLCDRVTQCATELNPETPAEEEVAQYRSDCLADVCERAELTREQACLDTDGAQCATFFQCLQEIDTEPDPDTDAEDEA